jgi:ppGpp synthetase/RelA/SpoT-type nucleotidyltranferase
MASLDFETENRNFREWYGANSALLRTAEKTFRNLIHLLLSGIDGVPLPKVLSRVKDRDECVKKFQRKYQAELEESETEYEIRNHITDILGVRVVCLYESNIQAVVSALRSSFDVVDVTDKTKELEEKEDRFGYKGLHLDLRLDAKRKKLPEYEKLSEFQFEVQVRTIAQDAWSEIDHKLKYKKDLPRDLKRRVYNLAGLFELADREFDSIRQATDDLVAESLRQDSEDGALAEHLSPFNFLRLMKAYFPSYQFEEHKIEGFVDEIRDINPDITYGQVVDAMDDHFDRVQEYRQWSLKNLGRNLNPYTEVRHVLVRSNVAIYEGLLFDRARDNFFRWDVDGSVFRESAND